MVVHNPYKKTEKKRTERPWEQQQAGNDGPAFSSRAESSAAGGSVVDDEYADFDWEAAGRLADQASQVMCSQSQSTTGGTASATSGTFGSSSTCYDNAITGATSGAVNGASSYRSDRENTSNRSNLSVPLGGNFKPSASTAGRPPLPVNNSTSASISGVRRAPAASSLASNARPPRPESQKSGRQQETNALAMLRPENWSKNKALLKAPSPARSVSSRTSSPARSINGQQSSSPSLNNNNNRYNDPRQESLPAVLQFNPDTMHKPVQDKYRQQLVQHAQLSQPLLNGWTLYSHQKKAILRGLVMRRMILALDMGLGKTLIGCVWSKAFVRTMENLKVIVICPVSLKAEWKRTMEQAVGLTVQDPDQQEGKKKKKTTKKKGKAEIDDDGDSENNAGDPDVHIVSWAKIPTHVDYSKYVVVADEAHSMQSMQAARTNNALQLMKSATGVLLLSGTPMKNGKPSNLFPLLKAVGHALSRHQRAYEAHFCQGHHVQFGRNAPARWTATGSANLTQLRELTQSHVLYLTKEECLRTSLPSQKRVTQTVPVSSHWQLKHTQALQKLAQIYSSSSDGRNSLVSGSSTADKNEAVLGAVQKLRVVGSMAKIDGTVQLAKQVLQEEAAVVIFTTFCQVAKTVHQKLAESGWHGELLTGETPAKKRQGLVDNFQNGLSPVFCCTFGAGGVGLTLTAAHTIILLDRPWTPGEAFQAEDRVRRIGQTKPVRSIWMSAFDLDEQIDEMLKQKSETAQTVLSSKHPEQEQQQQDAAAAPKLSIFQMLQKVLPTYTSNQQGAVGRSSSTPLKQTSMLQYCSQDAN